LALFICIVALANPTTVHSASPNLVAAYGFDEGSGGTVADASGNGNTGTISGATWTNQGKFGTALAFGGNAWVTVNDAPSLDLRTGMTLMAWVYPTAPATQLTTVIGKEQPGDILYALFGGGSNKRPRAAVYLGSRRVVTGSADLPLDTWSHLAATYNNSTLRLYVNGVQVASKAMSGSLPVSTEPLRIGGDLLGGNDFTGRIDEVRVYNRGLTATEIQTDMETPVGGAAPPGIASLTVTLAGAGTGTVTSSPGGIDCGSDCGESYPVDSVVTLTAAPDAGSRFAGWGAPCTGTGSCTLTLAGAHTVMATFNASGPSAGGGIPFGPFHFGERATDYTYVRDGAIAGEIFTGGFIGLKPSMTTTTAQSLLAAAKSNGKKVIVTAANSDPCYYWDGVTFNQSQTVADVVKFLPLIAEYQDVVVGILLFNEPHNPDRGCAPVPARVLYDAARAIRAEFSRYGLSPGFPLGYGSHPAYFETVAADGTINLSNTQYAPQKGTVQSFVSSQEATAASVGHKLYFTVNAEKDGTNVTADLDYVCKNIDPSITIMVGYWTWTSTGGNQAVPLLDLSVVRDSCMSK
jgi:hypothetical protein